MKRSMTDKEFKELVSKIDSEVLPTKTQPTKEEEEQARRDYYEWQKDWTDWNAG